MIYPDHLRTLVIRPTLKKLQMHSPHAEELLLGTAAVESRLGSFLRQQPTGPALGIYQMEPNTHLDIWVSFLHYRPRIQSQMALMLLLPYGFAEGDIPPEDLLVGNLYYATAMARLHYLRVEEPLPPSSDV